MDSPIPQWHSSHSGRSGPLAGQSQTHSIKPEEKFYRKDRNAASSNSLTGIRTDNLHDYSHTSKIPDHSPGSRRPLSEFFSSIATMLSRKSSGQRKDRQRIGSIGWYRTGTEKTRCTLQVLVFESGPVAPIYKVNFQLQSFFFFFENFGF